MDTGTVSQTVSRTASRVVSSALEQARDSIRSTRSAFLAFHVFLILITPPLFAQEGSPVTRADPVTFWEFAGNPAAQAFSGDAFSLAFRENIDLSNLDVQVADPIQNLDLGLGLGGLRYNSLHGTDSRTNRLSSALGLRAFGAGAGVSWVEGKDLTGPDSRYDLGILYRPFNLLSLGITLEDASSASPAWGAGLAVRPLSAWPRLESILTLSADARLQDGKTLIQNVATRLRLGSWLGLKAWIEPKPLRFGLQTHLRLGSGESELVFPDAGAMHNITFASALRLDLPGRRTPLPFRKTLLVIDDIGLVPSSPPILSMPGFREKIWLDSLVDAVDRAAVDPQVGGIVIYHPPVMASAADAQALHRSLSTFKASGKPVYAYARTLGRSSYIYTAASADYLALDPNGQLDLVDLGFFDLYYRGFFEKLGIRMYNLQSHDTKTAYNNFTEYGITEAERTMKERFLEKFAAQGYTALEKARGDRLKKDAASLIGAGPYLIPSQAVEAGLVDALAYRDEFDKTVDERMGRASRLDIRDYLGYTGDSWAPPRGTKTVAVLYLQGNIINAEGVAGRSIGEATARTLASLREDNSVAGLLIRVDSGGGSALMSDLIAHEVALTVEAGKPVYVSMGGHAASGGYYISAPATRIYAEQGTITGSIGVTGLWPEVSGLLEKLDINTASVDAGNSAGFGNMLLPRREEDAAMQAAAIAHIYQRFITVVAQGRSMDMKMADELGRGQVWLGSEAVANGLVDEIGGLDAAKAGIREELGGPVHFANLLPGQNPASIMSEVMDLVMDGMVESVMGNRLAAAISLAAELEEIGSGPQTLFADYLFRNRADR